MSQFSEDYSKGFNDARRLDREAIRDHLIEKIDMSRVAHLDEYDRTDYLEDAIDAIDLWLDCALPLEEPEEEEEEAP